MPPQLRTMDATTPRVVQDNFRELVAAIARLEADVVALKARLDQQPPVLTLEEINAELSADGTAPLNLTGLPGAPVLSP